MGRDTSGCAAEALADPKIKALFEAHPALGTLDEASLKTVAKMSRIVVCRPGRTIQKEGENADTVFFVLDGMVRVFHRSHSGDQVTLQILNGPAVLNDVRAITGTAAVECAVTLRQSTMLLVPAQVFCRLLSLRPALAEQVLQDMATRQCLGSDRVRRLAFDDIDTRLADLLLEYAELVGTPLADGEIRLEHAFSQQSMAHDLGASRKSINRALERFKDAGLIEKVNARYCVRDVDALRACASGALGMRHSSLLTPDERLGAELDVDNDTIAGSSPRREAGAA